MDSDVDIAISFGRRISGAEDYRLLGDVTALYETDRVDLVLVDEAGPLLQKEIAAHGRPLYEAERGEFDRFIIRALARYQDTAVNRRLERELVDEFLEERGLGAA